jgi:phosphoribosylanthranilate isomerase
MRRVRVKICGITRAADAALSAELGADALGFVFWPTSPRVILPADAAAIARNLPPFVARVGVFVDAPPEEVGRIAREVGLDAVQLHGDEAVEAYRSLGVRVIKGVGLETAADVSRAVAWPAEVTPLVDAVDRDRRGGTGRVADWALAAEVARARAVMLAGGLTAETVAAAVAAVRPWAVDVSSGVEASPGIKSPDRLRAWFAVMARVATEWRSQ